MKKLKSYEIRQMWLDFWKSKGHEVFPSASLVPVNDPTLLWINAGVAPLKKFFDGREVPTNRRICNAQKAIRTNDIDNVGRTARHHTFFEMLGNFSIGDYFRKEALTWAYELLTSEKWFAFDVDKLYFTIYPDDKESYELWTSLGVDPSHIVPLKGNFWEIGEGPCGPDSEIFYDRGEKYDKDHLGIKMLKEDIENDRYIEIWNIVFSQFNAQTGVNRSEYKELPSKNIDTGSGLERLACVMQGVETNYETDLFMPLIEKLEEMTGVKYTGQMAFKVISDHIRSVTFALSDGANLSNEGRGYVLRRILRRAVRYGKVLGMDKPFMYNLVEIVASIMRPFYPYLDETKEMVKKVIKNEEEKFLQTLETGEKKLLEYIKTNEGIISKEFAFLLYDTFGFPIELTMEVAQENGREVDYQGFLEELKKQKLASKKSRNESESMNKQNEDLLAFKDESEFVGYDLLENEAKVIAIFKDGSKVTEASGKCSLVFDKTCFYATSGGQAGDNGVVVINDKAYQVLDSYKLPNNQHAILVECEKVSLGDKVILKVDKENRKKLSMNHSGTHLLNEALRKVLGSHVKQQGSSVTSDLLRFDFNNFELPNDEQLIKIETIVNDEINKNSDTSIVELPLEEAKKLGVQAMFGEKYGKIVRVATIGFSKELCGGTHVTNTKEIQKLACLGVESKGSGIFRIECVTGSDDVIINKITSYASQLLKDIEVVRQKINDLILKSKKEGIILTQSNIEKTNITASYLSFITLRKELNDLREEAKNLDKEYAKLKLEKNSLSLEDFINDCYQVNDKNILFINVKDVENQALKDLVDRASDKINDSVIFLSCVTGGKIVFICKNKLPQVKAGDLVKLAATITLGGGGGRPDYAQAGGKDITKLDEALKAVKQKLEDLLCA